MKMAISLQLHKASSIEASLLIGTILWQRSCYRDYVVLTLFQGKEVKSYIDLRLLGLHILSRKMYIKSFTTQRFVSVWLYSRSS